MTAPTDRIGWWRAVRESDLPPLSRLVALTLSTYMDPDGGRCWPAQATVADAAGLGRRTVQRHLDALEEGGWLVVEQYGGVRPREGRGQATHLYVPMLPASASSAPPDDAEVARTSAPPDDAEVARTSASPGGAEDETTSAPLTTTSAPLTTTSAPLTTTSAPPGGAGPSHLDLTTRPHHHQEAVDGEQLDAYQMPTAHQLGQTWERITREPASVRRQLRSAFAAAMTAGIDADVLAHSVRGSFNGSKSHALVLAARIREVVAGDRQQLATVGVLQLAGSSDDAAPF